MESGGNDEGVQRKACGAAKGGSELLRDMKDISLISPRVTELRAKSNKNGTCTEATISTSSAVPKRTGLTQTRSDLDTKRRTLSSGSGSGNTTSGSQTGIPTWREWRGLRHGAAKRTPTELQETETTGVQDNEIIVEEKAEEEENTDAINDTTMPSSMVQNTAGLAVATLVNEPSTNHILIPRAQELELEQDNANPKPKPWAKRIALWLVLLLVLALVTGVSVGIVVAVLNRKNDTVEIITMVPPTTFVTSVSPTTAPTSYHSLVFLNLPTYTQQTLQLDVENIGPQALAWNWTIHDPNLHTYPEWRIHQRFALATLYFATNGHNWYNHTSWLNYQVSECNWWFHNVPDDYYYYCPGGFGTGYDDGIPVTVYDMCTIDTFGYKHDDIKNDSTIAFLPLSTNNLEGTLPPEIAMLTSLWFIDLSNNNLVGTITSLLGRLTDLLDLRLQANSFEAIATDLALPNLLLLNLGNNGIGGRLPSSIYQWSSLKKLFVEENELTGPLPSEIGQLTSLQKLHVFRNNLNVTGIPTEWASLTRLREFLVADNALPATLPSELGLLTRVSSLDVIGNYGIDYLFSLAEGDYSYTYTGERHSWVGSIPTELGRLSLLRRLDLSGGGLSGNIPSELGLMREVVRFNLQDNNLEGSLPSELGLLHDTMEINLSGNRLVGTIPPEWSEYKWSIRPLIKLDLSRNFLSGFLPTRLGLFLRVVSPTPSGISNCGEVFRRRELQSSDFESCDELYYSCEGIQELNLSSNRFSGPIPPEFGDLTSLESFSAGYNELTGSIPTELGLWRNVIEFDITRNQMTGGIPIEMSFLVQNYSLKNLHLSDNFFTGILPGGLCVLEPLNLTFDCSNSTVCGCSCDCNLQTQQP